ncbi:hypothetical protein D3C81_169980 [compost metagenome]
MEATDSSEPMRVAAMTYAGLWITDAVLRAVIAAHPHRDQLLDAIREQIAIARADSALLLAGSEVPELTNDFSAAAENWLSALDHLDDA